MPVRKNDIEDLIELRKIYTLSELAEEIECSRRSLIRWTKKQTKAQKKNRNKIQQFLNRRFTAKELANLRRVRPMLSPKEIRDYAGLSVGEFSQRLGVSPQTIYAWEKGRSKPSPLVREKLFRFAAYPDRDKYRKIKRKITFAEKDWLLDDIYDYDSYRKKLDLLFRKYEFGEGNFEIKIQLKKHE